MTAVVTVYVGMALTEAPPEFRDGFQQELKSGLRMLPGVTVLDFVGLEGGTALDVYRHDRGSTLQADLAIFICDHPSTGMGMEIMVRHYSRRPTLLFAATGSRVTRMVLGFSEAEQVPLHRYGSVQEIVASVQRWVEDARLTV